MGFSSWFRQAPKTFYRQVVGQPFTNGGQEYGLVKQYHADPFFYDTGTGYRFGLLRVYQAPQVYAPLRVPISGLGGVQAGQVILQPLTNPDYTPLE
jgi:hypothetical protein